MSAKVAPRIIGVIVVMALVTLIAAGFAVRHYWQAPCWPDGIPVSGTIEFRVEVGAAPASVARDLRRAGLLRSDTLFLAGARLTGRDRRIRAGLYALPIGASPSEILSRLTIGRTLPVKLTLPEGLTADETSVRVEAAFGIQRHVFLAAADSIMLSRDPALGIFGDTGLRRSSGYHPCEGYLWPETYHFEEGSLAPGIAAALIDAALRNCRELRPDVSAMDLTLHEILTLASIVEAETPLDLEKPKVAAVYLNRLRIGRPLEADPTIAYLMDKKGQRILFVDLETVSPYNTYLTKDLPPGPVANPGRAALKAVIEPEPGFTALYFVADGLGGHVFSHTFREHQEAAERYRQSRRAQERKLDAPASGS